MAGAWGAKKAQQRAILLDNRQDSFILWGGLSNINSSVAKGYRQDSRRLLLGKWPQAATRKTAVGCYQGNGRRLLQEWPMMVADGLACRWQDGWYGAGFASQARGELGGMGRVYQDY